MLYQCKVLRRIVRQTCVCVLWRESIRRLVGEGMSWAVNPIFSHMDGQMSLHSELQMSSLKKRSEAQLQPVGAALGESIGCPSELVKGQSTYLSAA